MKIMMRLILIACVALSLLACDKTDSASKQAGQPAVAVPAGEDQSEWGTYVRDVVIRNMGTITNQPYVYLLPGEGHEDFEGNYERMAERVFADVGRGVLRGNLLAFASPASDKMADIVIQSFAGVTPDSMKGVRLLFIGAAADGERVREAVTPAGLDYVVIDTGR